MIISKDRRILIRKRLDEITEKLLSDREATITVWHLAYVLESISYIWDELARDHEADIKAARADEREAMVTAMMAAGIPNSKAVLTINKRLEAGK